MGARRPGSCRENPAFHQLGQGPQLWGAGLIFGLDLRRCDLGTGSPCSVVVGVVLWVGRRRTEQRGGGGWFGRPVVAGGPGGVVAWPHASLGRSPVVTCPLNLSVLTGKVLTALRDCPVPSGLMALELGPHWRPQHKSWPLPASRGSDRAREITWSIWSHTGLAGQGQGDRAAVMSSELAGLNVGAGGSRPRCAFGCKGGQVPWTGFASSLEN